jgi:DNA modification methylase
MIPARVAIALQADGWYLRSDIIWAKPNPMPESVTDRPTTSHEHVFLLTKRPKYFYDAEAVKEEGIIPAGTLGAKGSEQRFAQPGINSRPPEYKVYSGTRNLRNVWTIATHPYSEAHFATFPPELAERCIKAGTSEKGCCPTCGAPWKRQVDTSYDNPGNRTTNGPRSLEQRHETAGFAVRLEKRTATTGWKPTCTCPPAEPVPCTVLDPFAGAFTTALVADRLGRDAIGVELNADYIAMARERIISDAGMFADFT